MEERLLKKVKETILSKNLFWDEYGTPEVKPKQEVSEAQKIERLIIAIQNERTSVAEFMYNYLTGRFEKLYSEGKNTYPDVLPPKMFLELFEGHQYVVIYAWYNKVPDKYTHSLKNKILQQWEAADRRKEYEIREKELDAAEIKRWKGQ